MALQNIQPFIFTKNCQTPACVAKSCAIILIFANCNRKNTIISKIYDE